MTADLLHAGLGWPTTAALIAVSFIGSLIAIAFGIGGGVLVIAVFATLLPAAAIIPVHGLVQLGSNFGRAVLTIRHLHWPIVLPFLLGSMAGVAIGSAFVVQVDAAMIQICVGLFIFWTILVRPPAIMRRSGGIAGAISSFLTMLVGSTGPFVAAIVKSLPLDRVGYTATFATLQVVQHTLKSVAFGFLGFAFSAWAGLVALLIAAGFLGTLAGRHVLLRIDEKLFRTAMNLILAALALRLIYAGATTLATP